MRSASRPVLCRNLITMTRSAPIMRRGIALESVLSEIGLGEQQNQLAEIGGSHGQVRLLEILLAVRCERGRPSS